ncbi:alpha/beta hydrolase [Pontibacter liquoris]|uniref:alpha/beta hydrolase n=1 Tax=Pontibacter liquoris TaxID=2905677 RepID=UPI001FA73AA7|nr:alpha/beta hydrolase-fold protein [Pontibacter liquoris]
MKKQLLLAFLVLVPVLLFAQTGKVLDNLSLKSKILKANRKYAIYLPPDYETSQRSYPVLYLLHGAGDDQTGWVQFGEVLHIADKAIKNGTATPMIIVMPDANTGQRGYFNSETGDWRYEDFFFEEFMPFIEKTYRIKADKRNRAIAGLSMGGGGSFMYALRHPDLFSSACPLSAATGPLTPEEAKPFIERIGNKTVTASAAQLEAYYKNNSVLQLLNTVPAEQVKSVKWYIDCGDDDFLYEGNSLVHIAMRKKEIPHEFRVRDGGHTWTYWRQSLPKVLSFVSDTFHQH